MKDERRRQSIEFDPNVKGDLKFLEQRWEAVSISEVVRRCIAQVADQERLVIEKGGHIAHIDASGQVTRFRYV